MPHIYFDHNATTPLAKQAAMAMEALQAYPLNASSVHAGGRYARQQVEKSRQSVMKAVGGESLRLIFTATGTEANHLALCGTHATQILVSAIEHPSVLKASPHAEKIPVTTDGIIDLSALEQQLDRIGPQPYGHVLVSVMLANNETGVIQPLTKISELAHHYGAIVHTDAVQALGKIPLDMAALGVDMMTISGHKCGGPQGVAALLVNKAITLHPLLRGGGQEQGYRAGTENVMAIAGFGAVVQEITPGAVLPMDACQVLRSVLEQRIQALTKQPVIVGANQARLPNTSCIIMPGVTSETQMIEFDLKGFAVSAGSACSSGKITSSHVLAAMGLPQEDAMCAIRVSLGLANTHAEIEQFVAAWKTLYLRVHA